MLEKFYIERVIDPTTDPSVIKEDKKIHAEYIEIM